MTDKMLAPSSRSELLFDVINPKRLPRHFGVEGRSPADRRLRAMCRCLHRLHRVGGGIGRPGNRSTSAGESNSLEGNQAQGSNGSRSAATRMSRQRTHWWSKALEAAARLSHLRWFGWVRPGKMGSAMARASDPQTASLCGSNCLQLLCEPPALVAGRCLRMPNTGRKASMCGLDDGDSQSSSPLGNEGARQSSLRRRPPRAWKSSG